MAAERGRGQAGFFSLMLASAHPCVRERKDEREKESERGRGNKRPRLIEKKTNRGTREAREGARMEGETT